jgi:hypothetical protein
MSIPRSVIVAKLRERGQNARADFVEKDLPEDVDPVRHSGLLKMLNLRPEDLTPSDEYAGENDYDRTERSGV